MKHLKTTTLMAITGALTALVFMLAPRGKVQQAQALPPCSRYWINCRSYFITFVNGQELAPNVWYGYNPGDPINTYIKTGCSAGYLPVADIKAEIYVVNVGWVKSDTGFVEMPLGIQAENGYLTGMANQQCTEATPGYYMTSALHCQGGGQ